MSANPPPAPVVEIGFSDGPLAASPAWTNVSARVRAWATDRSRDELAGKFQAGQAHIVLDNRDRALEPFAAGGLGLKRRQPVRIRFADGTPVFRGMVDLVELSYPNRGKDAVATLTCTDLLGYLATIGLQCPYSEAVLADQPLIYLPLTEGSGTVASDLTGNTAGATYDTVGVTHGQDHAVPDDQGGSVLLSDPYPSPVVPGHGAQITGTLTSVPNAFSVEFWFKGTTIADWFYPFGSFGLTSFVEVVVLSGTGQVALAIFTSTTSSSLTGSLATGVVLDGHWHHVVVTAADATAVATWRLYVDGALDAGATTATVGGSTWTPSPTFVIGYPWAVNNTGVSGSSQIERWALYGRALTQPQVAQHTYAGQSGLTGTLPGMRVNTIAGYAGIPTALVSAAQGRSWLTDAGDLSSGKALDHLRDVEVSEAGALFADRSGVLTFRARDDAQGARPASTTAAVSFPAAGVYADVTLADPTDQIVNDVTVNARAPYTFAAWLLATSSTKATSQDLASVAENGDLSSTVSSIAPSESASRADYEVVRRSHPTTLWITSLTFSNRAEPIALELWDRVTVNVQPPGGGSAIVQDSLVTGIAHTYDVLTGTLTTILRLNPVEATVFGRWGGLAWGRSDTLWDLTAKWGSATTPWGSNTWVIDATTARWFF